MWLGGEAGILQVVAHFINGTHLDPHAQRLGTRLRGHSHRHTAHEMSLSFIQRQTPCLPTAGLTAPAPCLRSLAPTDIVAYEISTS